jgi:2-methylcitrate dehydratase PrpD
MSETGRSAVNVTLTDRVLEAALRSVLGAPSEAFGMARACLLDWTGCAIAGAREPMVEVLLADAVEFGRIGTLPVVGRSERLGLRESVLVNGTAGHALDYDDGLSPMMGHPSVAITPALLALSAYIGKSGRDLATAFLLAVDVAARVGRLLSPDHYRRGFHGTATAGAIGAAAGCAWLVGLQGVARAGAIGLAATRAAGLKASFGTMAKPLHAGWAAQVGLTAVQWAQRGFTGHTDVLGHPSGLRALSETFEPDAALADAAPYVLSVRFKRHASCAGTHPTIEAMRQLRRKHNLRPERIVRATIRVDRLQDSICNQHNVRTGLQAKFSLRMVSAMVLAEIDTAARAACSSLRRTSRNCGSSGISSAS